MGGGVGRAADRWRNSIGDAPRAREMSALAPGASALDFTRGRSVAPPLWGRTEEGGRAVLRDEPAMAHSIISSVRATPHPCPPPQEGANAIDSTQMQQALEHGAFRRRRRRHRER